MQPLIDRASSVRRIWRDAFSALALACLSGIPLNLALPSTAGAQAPASSVAPPAVQPTFATSLGPLRVAERSPFFRLFLTPVVEGADLVPDGETRVHMGFAYSNIFELGSSPTHDILFDLERLTSGLTVRHGLTPDWEVGFTVSTQTNWGGFLDPVVQGVHRTFGFPNADRDKVPDGDYELRVTRLGGSESLVAVPPGTLLEDPTVHAARRLVGGEAARSSLSLRATAKIPLGERAAGTGRADGALELVGRRSWRHTHVHAHAGVVLIGASGSFQPYVHRTAGVAGLGVERRVGQAVSLAAQVQGGTPYGRNFDAVELDGTPLNLVIGVMGETAGDWHWQFSFAEDLQPEGPSVDFTLDLQLSRRW